MACTRYPNLKSSLVITYHKPTMDTQEGYTQIYKGAGSNGSKRTHAAFLALQTVANSKTKRQKGRRSRSKAKKIQNIPEYAMNAEKMIRPKDLNRMKLTFYDNSDSSSRNSVNNLQTIDTLVGAVTYLPTEDTTLNQKVPAFILLARQTTITAMGNNARQVVRALDDLHLSEKSVNRSSKKTGQSTTDSSYSILGEKVLRGGHGMSLDALSLLDNQTSDESRRTLVNWANRVEKVSHTVLPSSILRGLVAAYKMNDWTSLVGRNKHGGTYVSLATSKNYRAPPHVDKDFFLSLHQVNVDRTGSYELNEDIVQYMCFPGIGLAVGLRPGDVLIFNPGTYHCLSEKECPYNGIDVHVSTLYIKTAHVGKNDNRLPLTRNEDSVLKSK